MRRNVGQSLVEMALLLPLMVVLLFGIIDMGWYVYGYASIYQAVRNGSEAAASLPPFEDTLTDPALQADDPCYHTIVEEVKEDATMFQDIGNFVEIDYPDDTIDNKRDLGNPIEVKVKNYNIVPLTPLFQFIRLGNTGNGVFTVNASAIRSIESLGNTPVSDDYPNGIVCK
jgi:hypothetical protein